MSDPFPPGTKDQIENVRDEAITQALEENGLEDVAKARDLHDGVNDTLDLVNKAQDMADRPAGDLIEAMTNLRPAGDLADLIDSIPFLGNDKMPGMSTLQNVLEQIQEMIDAAQDYSMHRFKDPWNHGPDGPPPPPPPPPPEGGGGGGGGNGLWDWVPWRPKDGPDAFKSPPKDPFVLDLDGGGVTLVGVGASSAYFDLDGNGFAEKTGWIGAGEGFLVLDQNNNGKVDDIGEMFGDAQTDGFDELVAYDTNLDGRINASDTAFSSLRVWRDADGDAVTGTGELLTLAQLGITEIGLSYDQADRAVLGNLVAREGEFTINGVARDASTVWFGNDQLFTRYILPEGFAFDPETLLLPDLMGFGEVTDLRVAMTQDSTLKDMVKDLVLNADSMSHAAFVQALEAMIWQWAGVDAVAPGARGPNVDAQHLEVLQHFYGSTFAGNPNAQAGLALEGLYDGFIAYIGQTFISQVGFADVRLHITDVTDALENAMWAFASAGYDGSVASIDLKLATTVERMASDERLYHKDDPFTYVGRVAPWLAAFRNGEFSGDHAAFGQALQYWLHTEFTDNAVKVAAYEAAMGANVIETVGDLVGTAKADLIVLDAVDAFVNGGGGSDTYAVERGVQVAISDGGSSYDTDTLLLEGRLLADAIISEFGETYVIRFADDPNSTVVVDAGAIERFVFMDQTVTLAQIASLARPPATSGDDLMLGHAWGETFLCLGGDDTMTGGGGDDRYVFHAGFGSDVVVEDQGGGQNDELALLDMVASDVTFQRAGQDLLVHVTGTSDVVTVRDFFEHATIEKITFSNGETLNKAAILATVEPADGLTITGTSGEDTLESTAGADRLSGGNGGDTYIYHAGDGYDVIADARSLYTSGADEIDTLVLDGVASTDVKFSFHDVAYGAALVIDIGGAQPGRVTIEKGLRQAETSDGRIERFVFSNGVTLTWQDVEAMLVAQSMTDGNDLVTGMIGDDVLAGGKGDDVMDGWTGNDTFVWSLGDGRDIVTGASHDVLVLHGVDPDDVVVRAASSSAQDIMLLINGSMSQAIVLERQKYEAISQVRFDDGTLWDAAELVLRLNGGLSEVVTHQGAVADETLEGSEGRDVLAGGGGDDLLIGGEGSDLYLYASGDGNDVIQESLTALASADMLRFEDLDPDDVTLAMVDNELQITVIATGAVIKVEHQTADSGQGIERIVFQAGTAWTRADIFAHAAIQGTAGDDELSGYLSGSGIDPAARNQVFDGGLGDDVLYGEEGGDTYLWSVGDGNDHVRDLGAPGEEASTDVLWLRDVLHEDVILGWSSSGDLNVQILSSGEVIEVAYQRTPYQGSGIEALRFADGTVWDRTDLAARAILLGGPGEDWLDGTPDDDILMGALGDDSLTGMEGSDVYLYHLGDGSDGIFEYRSAPEDVDTLSFLDVAADQLVFQVSEYDLNSLWVATPNGEILYVENQFWAELNGYEPTGDGIEIFAFADGTSFDRAQVFALAVGGVYESLVYGDAADDVLTGGALADFISGLAGADTIDGGDGGDWIIGGEGDDNLHGGGGDDTLNGGNGDDQLTGGAGFDTLIGGDGDDVFTSSVGDDGMEGGWGSDTYNIVAGDGGAVIFEFAGDGADQVVFGAGVLSQDVALSRIYSDLVLTIPTAGDPQVVTVRGQFDDELGGGGVEQVTFADGTVWSRQDLRLLVLAQAATDGDDVITGYASNDTLGGGLGNDIVDGGDGDDTFIFGAGDGHDEIYESSGFDVLELGAGLSSENLTVSIGDWRYDVVLSFASGESILLSSEIYDVSPSSQGGVEEIHFADGAVLTRGQLVDRLLRDQATDGDDRIVGLDRDDHLIGGLGADVFAFSFGHGGNDVIEDFDVTEDRVELSYYSVGDFEELMTNATQLGDDVLIQNDWQGSILLQGVSLSALTASNFDIVYI
jgi:Ca2+-binding RTX toxin-like protein